MTDDILEAGAEVAAEVLTEQKQEEPPAPESFWRDFMPFLLVAMAIVIPLRLFIVQPFIVSGSSMVPTFEHGHYLVVDELTYRFREPMRGEVLIFKYPQNPKKFFIKRLLALPGDKVEIRNGVVTITPVDGEPFEPDESYVRKGSVSSLSVTLGDDEYFVAGDNRPASSDSRSWGPIEEDHIIGRPILRLFPVTQFDYLPGDYSENTTNVNN